MERLKSGFSCCLYLHISSGATSTEASVESLFSFIVYGSNQVMQNLKILWTRITRIRLSMKLMNQVQVSLEQRSFTLLTVLCGSSLKIYCVVFDFMLRASNITSHTALLWEASVWDVTCGSSSYLHKYIYMAISSDL